MSKDYMCATFTDIGFTKDVLFNWAVDSIKFHKLSGKPTIKMMSDVVACDLVNIIDSFLYQRGVSGLNDLYDHDYRNEVIFTMDYFGGLSEVESLNFIFGEEWDT